MEFDRCNNIAVHSNRWYLYSKPYFLSAGYVNWRCSYIITYEIQNIKLWFSLFNESCLFFLFIFSRLFLSHTVLCETPYFLSFLYMDYLTVVLKCCSADLCGNVWVIPSRKPWSSSYTSDCNLPLTTKLDRWVILYVGSDGSSLRAVKLCHCVSSSEHFKWSQCLCP